MSNTPSQSESHAEERPEFSNELRLVEKFFLHGTHEAVRIAALTTEGKPFFLVLDIARARIFHAELGRALGPNAATGAAR